MIYIGSDALRESVKDADIPTFVLSQKYSAKTIRNKYLRRIYYPRPLPSCFPPESLERARLWGFISEVDYENQYRKHIREHNDFTEYFWRKHGLSDTENIFIVQQSGLDIMKFSAAYFLCKELVKYGYKCVSLYKRGRNSIERRMLNI